MDSPFIELAKIIKARDNPKLIGPIIGIVEKIPPNLEIRINEKILLKKHQIIMAKEKMKGYTREFHFTGNFNSLDMKFETTFTETTPIFEVPPVTHPPDPHKHEIKLAMSKDTDFEGTGKIDWTDELKVGDMVIILPMNNNNLFFLLDKADKYGGG
ncbi:MAG: DUF2577 family protein [Psychrilyobacter sp.]|uniref:DUF2577 family protein n=1 Tax=Psychrilyobacter sp. TaxID=2586924 RepID=UPI003C724EF6